MGKPARLGRCPRCKGYVLVDDADGIRLAVDVAPVDAVGYGVAVVNGVRLWWAETTPGRPSRVLGPLSGSRNPSWGPGGAQTSIQKLHAEHSCGAPHRDIAIINVQSDTGKGSAPATPGAAGAGSHHRAAPVAASPPTGSSSAAARPASPSPAATATPHLSEVLGRCGICGVKVRKGQKYWSITWGNDWVDGGHEECP